MFNTMGESVMRTTRASVLAGVAVVAAMGVAACGNSAPGSNDGSAGAASSGKKETGPVKIGVASGTTGPISFFDAPALQGMKIAVADINAKGGVAGRRLQLVTADHKSDINQIAPAALKVIEGGAKIVLGSCDYDFAGPAARTAQSRGLLSMACAGSPVFGKQGIGPLAFNAYPATPTEGAVMADFALQKGWKRVFTLTDQGLEYSKTVCQYFTDAFKAAGGTIVGADTFKNDDPSIQSQVTKVKGSSIDAVVLCSYPPGGASAVKQLHDAGVKLPIVGAGAFDGTYWLKGIPNLSDFYNPAQGTVGDEKDPDRKAIFDAYQKATGAQAVSATYPLMGYAMIETLAKALQATNGSTDGKALAAALEKFQDVPLVVGKTTYTPACHVPLGREMRINQIQNGKESDLETIKPQSVPKSPC
jgi:branched-chain amino acid transport system substrate-binding protein